MKRLVAPAAFVAVAVLTATGASAGPAYDWSGMYIGLNAGYGWGTAETGPISFFDDTAGTIPGMPDIPGFSQSLRGAIGGVEAGHNWQFGSVVSGVVADAAAANINGTYTADPAFGYVADVRLRWLSTLRGNLGVAMNNFLFYGTAGLAIGGGEAVLHDTYPGPTVFDTKATNTHVGWAAGLGVAAGITPNMFVKVEYLHVDLGAKKYKFYEDPSGTTGWPLITTNGSFTSNIVRASLDWRW